MVPEDLKPGQQVGEYEIEKAIGEGSFGKVYSAVHPMIGKKAAIKVLSYEHAGNKQFVSRFLEEARAVNKIQHRNIVDIFSFGKLPDGRQYFVMELLIGKAMGQWLAERGSIPIGEALPILRKVAKALEAAHKQGIAHRDLKPDNLFLTFDDDGTVFPKLLDFGIAKLMGDSPMGHKTQTGTPMGTPLYMSPEQCKGRAIDHRTDIYSFGVLVFEMLTGKRPFDSENVMDILMAHLSTPPPAMSSVNPNVPRALDPPVAKMLEKEPGSRPPSVLIAIEALIAAAKTIGIAIPSSRDNELMGYPPPTKVKRSQTVPQAPDPGAMTGAAVGGSYAQGYPAAPTPQAGYPQPPQPHASQPQQHPPQHHPPQHHPPQHHPPQHAGYPPPPTPQTKQSPVYQRPQPAAPHIPPPPNATTVDASLKPVGATLSGSSKSGSNIGMLIAGLLAGVLVIGGGVIAFTNDDDGSESEETTEVEVEDDDPGAGSKKRKKKAEPDPEPDKPLGRAVPFGDKTIPIGIIVRTNSNLANTFTVTQSGTKKNIAWTWTSKGTTEITRTDSGGVKAIDIAYTQSQIARSENHATPKPEDHYTHGQTYSAEKRGSNIKVTKTSGKFVRGEEKSIRGDASTFLGKNLLSKALGGKKIKIGEKVDLPFVTALNMLRDSDRSKFPKLSASITLQKVEEVGGHRVATFDLRLDFHLKMDEGGLMKSNLTGTLTVNADSLWVTSVELSGALEMTSADANTTYDKGGSMNYGYTNSYSRR